MQRAEKAFTPTARGAAGPTGAWDVDAGPSAQDERTKVAHGAYRASILLGVFSTLAAFAFGWFVAENRVLPGFFRASDVGMPVLMISLLTVLRRRILRDVTPQSLADASVGMLKGVAWAVPLFWTFLRLTNVTQFAFGLAAGIIAFSAYSARLQMKAHGLPGFGAGARSALWVLGAWSLWTLARGLLGAVPGFSLLSAGFGIGIVLIVLAIVKRDVTSLGAARSQNAPSPTKEAVARTQERRTVVAIILSYIVFRLFLSSAIPYGPIVEWFLICMGILFFSLIAAKRIGTVDTMASLPPRHVTRHVQVVSSLPDERLAENERLIRQYIDHAVGHPELVDALEEHYTLADIGPMDARRASLEALIEAAPGRKRNRADGRSGQAGRLERQRLVHDACQALRTPSPTDTVKTAKQVRTSNPPTTRAKPAGVS